MHWQDTMEDKQTRCILRLAGWLNKPGCNVAKSEYCHKKPQ